MCILGVNGESRNERAATANRNHRRWGCNITNVGARKDVVVIVVQVERELLVRCDFGGKSVAAVVVEMSNIAYVVASFADHDRRSETDPLFRFICRAQAIVLKVAGHHAREGIVRRVELRIEADAERVSWSGRNAEDSRVSIDL